MYLFFYIFFLKSLALCLFLDVFIYFYIYFYLFLYFFSCFLGGVGLSASFLLIYFLGEGVVGFMPLFRCIFLGGGEGGLHASF